MAEAESTSQKKHWPRAKDATYQKWMRRRVEQHIRIVNILLMQDKTGPAPAEAKSTDQKKRWPRGKDAAREEWVRRRVEAHMRVVDALLIVDKIEPAPARLADQKKLWPRAKDAAHEEWMRQVEAHKQHVNRILLERMLGGLQI
ncbi:hypothetical protein CDD83_2090 [Cordyceps sp. RAO-2017]|nr:hypothetical protein CDD83_2090 [Cordyceps sp. RAO-2017]